MPISRAVLAAASLALSGCIALGGGVPESLAVSKGAVTIAGPRGYCVDRGLSRDGADESFVVLGSCAALSRGGQTASGTPVVMTAAVRLAPAAARTAPRDLERFVRSAAGRAALSRSGQAASVEILSVRSDGQALLLHIRDQSTDEAATQTDAAYWRAIFGLGDRVITANVLAFADRPISDDEGYQRLAAFVARLRAVNAAPAAPS